MSSVDKMTNWFLNSKIYDDGAYVAYYNGNKRGPKYPEITAYAINLSCMLFKLRNERIFLERAEKCAQYMDQITKNGAVPNLVDGLFYVFDTGIFVSSLFDLYDLTKKGIYLRQAQQSLEWMYSEWDGEQFKAVDQVPSQKAWYHSSSVHLAKMAIPLLKAAVHLGDLEHEKIAYKLLEKYKRLQLDSGNFRVNEESQITIAHPHCYAAEGFLYAFYHSKKNEYFRVADRASSWLGLNQNKDGSLCSMYTIHEEEKGKVGCEKTSDATSQASRIWKLLGVNRDGISKAYTYLNKELIDDGLPLLKHPSLKSRVFSRRRDVFSWPTFFFLHSLTLPFGQMEYCKDLF
jgi:hypothetical protein